MNTDIDVIIPTYNSASNLDICLSRLDAQVGRERARVMIVDGGSTDDTVAIAKSHNAEVFINRGQYGTGLNGARHYGEMRGESPYVWYLDSDNFLVERNVLEGLVESLDMNDDATMAIPVTAVDILSPSFCRWLSMVEIEAFTKSLGCQEKVGGCQKVDDLTYGLPNAVLIRRAAIVRVGGYDSDVRMLMRLRKCKLSKAIVHFNLHFYHHEANSILQYLRKIVRRILFFGRMTDSDLSKHFLEFPVKTPDHKAISAFTFENKIAFPITSLKQVYYTKNPDWLWGLVSPLVPLAVLLRHPVLTYRVVKRVL